MPGSMPPQVQVITKWNPFIDDSGPLKSVQLVSKVPIVGCSGGEMSHRFIDSHISSIFVGLILCFNLDGKFNQKSTESEATCKITSSAIDECGMFVNKLKFNIN